MSSTLNLPDLLEETNRVTDWYVLGAFLKMPPEELKDIEKRLSGEGIKRCKIELFTCWMKRYPNASWAEIAKALEKCDENETADRIRQCHLPPSLPATSVPPSQEQQIVRQGLEKVTMTDSAQQVKHMATEATAGGCSPAEQEALKHSFSYLVNNIDTAALLSAALSRNLITDHQRTECSNEIDPYKKAEMFVGYLQRAVNADYDNYYTIVQILKRTNQAHIASHLRDELAHTIRSIQQPSASSSTDEGLDCVVVPEALVEELADLRCAFANLICCYEEELQKSPEAQEKFVKFLPRLFHKAIDYHSFQSHFDALIEKEVSIFNTHYLKQLCTIFPEDVCTTTKQLVDEYEQQRKHFMASTTVTQFKQLFPATATSSKLLVGKVPIKLKLKNDWGSDTLDDLIKLVINFGVSGKAFHLSKVEDGCIAVIWLCSTTEIKQLKMAILIATGSLQTMGVLQVFIGEEELLLECLHSPTGTCTGVVGTTLSMQDPSFTVLNPKYSTMLAHIADINQCIVPDDLSTYADELLQARLITPSRYHSAIAVTGRALQDEIASLTAEVVEKIKISPHLFDELVDILEDRDKELAFVLCRESEIKGMMFYLCNRFCRFYKDLPDIPVSEWFWPKLDRTRDVTLGLVANENYTGDDQFTHSSLRKSADDIHSRKTEISYQAAFPKEVKKIDFKILVSGRPGSGKTVLLNKLSKDWTRGDCFENVPVLILVHLRELAALPTKVKLASIIGLYFDTEETDKIVNLIELCKGGGFCFALDGLDEYPHLNKHGDFITRLIRGSYLPKAAVVVTSRPTHSHMVKDQVQRHIEIIGFLPPQIREYIQEHYKNESKESDELIEYLQVRPNVMSMCYLPLHLAMVIFVHKKIIESEEVFSLPETETGIYWHFMKHTVIRHAKREYQEEDIMIREILDVDKFLSELSDKDRQAFHTICKLAYQSKLSANLIFSSQDIKEKFNLDKGNVKEVKEMGFGILSNYKKVTSDGDTSVFSFQHLTIQEFLGAYYLQCLSQNERIGEIAKYGSRRDMREVWKFFYGLMMMRNPVEHFQCFVQLIRQNSVGCENVLFLIKCAFESQVTKKDQKEMEDASDRVCHELLASQSGKINVGNISLDTADCLAIGHVIGKSHTHLTELLMNYCHVGPEGVQALQRQLGNVRFDSLKQMQIRSQLNPVGDEGGRDLIELLKRMENLSELRLYGNQLKTDRFRNLEPVISRMVNLRILVLTKNSLGPGAGVFLNVILKELPLLIQFYVSYNPLTTEGLAQLCPGLLHCSKLQRLGLRGCELDSDAGYELVKIINKLEELEQLELYRNHLGDEGVTVVCPALCQAKSLKQISFTKNDIRDDGACELANYVRKTQTLDQIRLFYNDVSSRARQEFYNAMKYREEMGFSFVKYAI